MPMIIGAALFALVLLAPRVIKLWRATSGTRAHAILVGMAAGPFVLGVATFAVVWALNPMHVMAGADQVGELAGLVVGSLAAIFAIVAVNQWKAAPPAVKE
jgi:hypothetical protein